MQAHLGYGNWMLDFPAWNDAPRRLRQLENGCGPLAAWGVLRYFHRRTSAARLISACRYTVENSTFVIALAVALREHGLNVTFYSRHDPAPNKVERHCYTLAEQIGVRMGGEARLEAILEQITEGAVPLILYNTDDDNGHISPLVGYSGGKVYLAHAASAKSQVMSRKELRRRWMAPEICRQCLIVAK